MSIAGLKSALGEGARANKYKVQFQRGGNNLSEIVKAASLPGHTVGVAEVYSQGRKLPVAGDAEYDTWECTVYNDRTLSNNSAIHEWMDAIDDFENNFSNESDVNTYSETVTVQQLDRQGIVTAEYELYNAWPTTVAPVELGADTNNTVTETVVTFVYSHYKRIS